MALPSGYSDAPLAPQIFIKDLDGVEQYRYETEQIAASPTQDFDLNGAAFHCGVNADLGWAVMIIDDPNNVLTDSSFSIRKSSIKRAWKLEIFLGQTSGTLQRWFIGKIVETRILRPGTALQAQAILAVGSALKLRDRTTIITRNQEKESDV